MIVLWFEMGGNSMYTINHMWIDNINGAIPEARSKVTGLYETMEQAKVGLNGLFM